MAENSSLAHFFADSLTGEQPKVNYLLFHSGSGSWIHRYVQDLCLAYCTDTLYSSNVMNLQLGTLFLLLLQNFSGQMTASYRASGQYIPNQLIPVIHHIEENYAGTSLKETAELFGFSPDYLNVLFKKATGKPVGDMIRDLKMQRAAELLINSDLSVSAIAEYLNYQDASSLIRSFRKCFGVTPAKYRKSYGKQVDV